MAVITDYSTLTSTVQDYLARGDLSAVTPNFVQNWEERFYRDPRNFGPWMETPFSSLTTASPGVPSDYLGTRVMYLSGQTQKPLVPTTLEQLYTAYPRSGSGGIPKWFSRDGNAFVFGPTASGTYTITGSYYAKPTALRSSLTNFLTSNCPDMLLYGALMEAEVYIGNDGRVALWQQAYSIALDAYRDLMKSVRLSGGSMQTLVA